MQNTSHLLMIRPIRFEYNAQTAVNNSFQIVSADVDVSVKAMQEFDAFVDVLQQHKIDVTVVEDTASPHTPDSVFPNNWISFHEDGSVVLYPMFAENRRAERKQHVLDIIEEKFLVQHKIDLSKYEAEHIFLEGTGSMVLDRENKIAYACLSPRTTIKGLDFFCSKMNFEPVAFHSFGSDGTLVYHTNVMMCIADKFAVICLESITDKIEKAVVIDTIKNSGKQIIEISLDQMNHFAGNMLQVKNVEGIKFLVMSTQAYQILTAQQLQSIESFNPIIHSNISTIETNGGGSARCMMAEVFLQPK